MTINCPYCNSALKEITDKNFYRGKIYDTPFEIKDVTFFGEKCFLCKNSDLPIFIGFELDFTDNASDSNQIESASVFYKRSDTSLLEVTNLYESRSFNNDFYISIVTVNNGSKHHNTIYSIAGNVNKHLSLEQIETIVNFS